MFYLLADLILNGVCYSTCASLPNCQHIQRIRACWCP